jgi:CDP-paratose 2-epimerase
MGSPQQVGPRTLQPRLQLLSRAPAILITGGAGFVGSTLCREFAADGERVIAFDNLKRRGAELNIPLLRAAGVEFVHGDVRNPDDLAGIGGPIDLIIEASAEPSVHAGISGSPRYLLDTNLVGAINCLELARTRACGFIFISSSRVYSIPALRAIELAETATRFEPANGCPGITEDFPTIGNGFRSLYGSSKLAAELLVEEYAVNCGVPAVVNRCGVIAGPGQFGRTDQGVFTLWVARHRFGGALRYTGFGGTGKQVRDILHPADLADLMRKQRPQLADLAGQAFCVGGGLAGSVSLLEYSGLCAEITGKPLDIAGVAQSADVDIPWFVADSAVAQARFDWRPTRSPRQIVSEIDAWLSANEAQLRPLFCG